MSLPESLRRTPDTDLISTIKLLLTLQLPVVLAVEVPCVLIMRATTFINREGTSVEQVLIMRATTFTNRKGTTVEQAPRSYCHRHHDYTATTSKLMVTAFAVNLGLDTTTIQQPDLVCSRSCGGSCIILMQSCS